jgi:8-oxo-dGTP pyrophosphatase MutT (NUDIX family)
MESEEMNNKFKFESKDIEQDEKVDQGWQEVKSEKNIKKMKTEFKCKEQLSCNQDKENCKMEENEWTHNKDERQQERQSKMFVKPYNKHVNKSFMKGQKKVCYNSRHDVLSKAYVFCANCGGFGHVYKNCNYPITSYGIICYRLKSDVETQSVHPEYLMVQRKDSLNFVEFIRGKYSLRKRKYIMKMFTNMTEAERQEIKNNNFEDIWMKLWKVTNCQHFVSEFKESKVKFDQIKNGYLLDTETGIGIIKFDIDYILENTISTIDQSEWGFPKGKRNINEQDMHCAIREFIEETSMKYKYLKIQNIKPVEEIFTGSNGIRYRHIYYIGSCSNMNDKQVFHSNITRKVEFNEIQKVQWSKFSESLGMIREQNVERRELFTRVNNIILKNICLV